MTNRYGSATLARMRAVALLAGILCPNLVWAHGGDPAVAYLNDPQGVGTVVDESLDITWVDADRPIPTGTATVDLFYVRQRVPSFLNGEIHPLLSGDVVTTGIFEKDLTNRYTWDTRNVPAGSYMIWSRVTEPVEKIQSPQLIIFSPGVVTIAHPGDPVYPALYFTSPDSPFKFADQEFELGWMVNDPDGTGTVTLEVGTSSLGVGYEELVTVPASQTTYLWDTKDVREGDWQIRATITDGRGLSFTTYSQYRLLVTHIPGRDAGTPDQGGMDAQQVADGGGDAGVADALATVDGGQGIDDGGGCNCVQPSTRSDAAGLALLSVVFIGLSRRRRR